MKRGQAFLAHAILLAPVLAAVLNLWAAGKPMTTEERAHLVQMLRDSGKEYLSLIKHLNEEQWKWKPAPGRWSVGQTSEHIVVAEAVIFRKMHDAVLSPRDPEWKTKTAGKADLLRRVMLDRTQKATVPETTRPQGLAVGEASRRFEELRARVIKFAEETSIPLEEHTAEHPFPAFNTLNGYQWLLLVPLHQMRHNLQIHEIKASSGYPG